MALALTMLLSLFLCQSTCGFKPCCQMIPPPCCVGLCNTAEECIPVIRFLHCYFQNKSTFLSGWLSCLGGKRLFFFFLTCSWAQFLPEDLNTSSPPSHERGATYHGHCAKLCKASTGVRITPAGTAARLRLESLQHQAFTCTLAEVIPKRRYVWAALLKQDKKRKRQTGYIQVLFKDQYYFFSKILLFVTQVRRQTPDYATLWLSFP